MSNIVNYTYWKWDAILPKEFCEVALNQVKWADAYAATVNLQNPLVDSNTRRTDVIFQHFMQPVGCITRRYVEEANNGAGWNFILSGQEDTQFGRYKSTDAGYYDWHMDLDAPKNGSQRKLSCVILLNDPSEFEGGVLQFKGLEDEIVLNKQGSVVVFPSFIEHRVTPVTKGVRYTAVTWVNGPAFR